MRRGKINKTSFILIFFVAFFTILSYGFDQLVDQSKVGTKYIFKKGDGVTETENILLVATTDNTSITINGTPVTTATRGAKFLKSISEVTIILVCLHLINNHLLRF